MLAALTISLVLTLAQPAAQSIHTEGVSSPASTELTVIGRRPDEPIEVIGPAIDRYLHSLKGRWIGSSYIRGGHPFRSWPASVCVKVDGLQGDAESRFREGLTARLGRVGLTTSDKCYGRTYVVVTSYADSTISQVQGKSAIVEYDSRFGDISDLSTIKSPIYLLEVSRDHRLQAMAIIVNATKLVDVSD